MDGDIEDGDFGRGGLRRDDVGQSSAFCLSVSIYALEFNLAMAR